MENNTIAFVGMLECVREYGGVRRFVHISTDEVGTGNRDTVPWIQIPWDMAIGKSDTTDNRYSRQ